MTSAHPPCHTKGPFSPKGLPAVPFRRLVVIIALCAAGCAPARVPWGNPDIPKDQWSRDWKACKRTAEADVVGYGDDTDISASSSSPFRDYDRNNQRQRINSEVAACMTDLGYRPLGKGE